MNYDTQIPAKISLLPISDFIITEPRQNIEKRQHQNKQINILNVKDYQQHLNFVEKAEKIQCSHHREQASQLDITQNTETGNRLICKNCDTLNKSILSFSQIQKYLEEWWGSELMQIDNFKEQFQQKIHPLIEQVNYFKKNFEIQFQIFKTQINSQLEQVERLIQGYNETFQNTFQKYQQTELKIIIDQISQHQLSTDILNNIAKYFSKQKISSEGLFQDDQFRIINPDNYFSQIVFNNISKQLESINKQLSTYTDDNPVNFPISTQNKVLYKYPCQLQGHANSIRAIAMSNNDEIIASTDEDGEIIFWQVSSKQKISSFKGAGLVSDLVFSPDDQLLAAAQNGYPYQVFLFNISPNNITQSNNKFLSQCTLQRIRFSQDSTQLVSIDASEKLKIWKLSNQQIIFEKQFPNSLLCLDLSKNNLYLSITSQQGQTYLCDCQQMEKVNLLVEWQAHEDEVFDTTFTPDSEILLTSSEQIKLWSVSQLLSNKPIKIPIKILRGNDDGLTLRMQIFQNGQFLVSQDQKLKIWNLSNGQLIYELKLDENKHLGFTNISLLSTNVSQKDQNKHFGFTSDMRYLITRKGGALIFYELNQ